MSEVVGQRSQPVWRLVRGETLVGEIHITGGDFPWLNGRFAPTDAFGDVQALFEEELALVDPEGEIDVDAWESVYQQITDALTLLEPNGTPVAEFLLHISGEDAWFRWSDEPFDKKT
jgi:hypothetical protein